jgi:PKD repeat protein
MMTENGLIVADTTVNPGSIGDFHVLDGGKGVEYKSDNMDTSSLSLQVGSEGNGFVREYRANLSGIETGGYVDFSDDNGVFKLVNHGQARTCNLTISMQQGSVITSTTAANIHIEADSTLSGGPSQWSDLSGATVTISHDIGSDGSVDNTEVIGEQTALVLPTANFTANVTQGYTPLWVNLTDSSENATGIEWFINGELYGSVASLTPLFDQPGIYNVTLVASNANGTNSTEKDISVTLRPAIKPTANFTANVTQGYAPLWVNLTDSSENAASIEWIINGASYGTAANIKTLFETPGIYNVTLVATNGNEISSMEKDFNVTSRPLPPTPPVQVKPTAKIGADITDGLAPLTVQFSDLSLNETLGRVWVFGDGTGSIEANPIHTYKKEGRYQVILTAASKKGVDIARLQINVTKPVVIKKPKADFSSFNNKGYAPLTVSFKDVSKDNPTSWKWDFGDGKGTADTKDATYVYATPGKYTVTLMVTNVGGTDTKVIRNCVEVLLLIKPKADFRTTNGRGYAPLTVRFKDTSLNHPTSWFWEFGDGIGTANTKDAAYTYTKPGKYTVTLTATNGAGMDKLVVKNCVDVQQKKKK